MTAKDKSATNEVETTADVSTTPDGWEFETVQEESPTRVIFDTIGDQFVGQYIGDEHIDLPPNDKGEDQSFDLFNFRGRDGERYAINKSYSLEQAMEKVTEGQWCRITYAKDVPTKRSLNPMKDFRVEVRKS
jgi:hypothetical protein